MPADALQVVCRELAGALVLAPCGVLDISTYGDLRTDLTKAAVEEPRAVVVDLDRLTVPDRSSLALFSSVSAQLTQWPGIPLLVSAGRDDLRRKIDEHRLARFVPVFSSVHAAVRAVDDPPVRRIARLSLPNSLVSAGLARQFVSSVCADWRIADVDKAVMVANELVENTLLHTYCAPSLRLELRRGLFTIAVYDDDPTPALLPEPGDTEHWQHGLAFIGHLATAWGCTPTPAGGKVVWVVLRNPSPPWSSTR